MIVHTGGCHCGAVRFEVKAPADPVVDDCNCSICARSGYLHLIAPAERFRLLQGEEDFTIRPFDGQSWERSIDILRS